MKLNVFITVSIIFLIAIPFYAQDYSFEVYANNGVGCQSATNYGKYLFLVKDRLSSISLYDLDEKKIIQNLQLESRDERINGSIISHCNQCSFGKEKYEENDIFPLLYISQRSPNDSVGAYLDVLRIIPNVDINGTIDSFQIEQVQKIFFPVMTDQNSMGNPNAIIDINKGFIYTYSRNNRPKANNYLEAVVSKFLLPSLYDSKGDIQKIVILHDNDILDSFNCGFSLLNAQGGFYRKGKIYFAQGYPSKNEKLNYVLFREINLKKRKLTRTVDMLNNGFRAEPEGCWFYNGKVMVTDSGKNLYILTGKKYKVK